jgi:chorismate synthase
MLRYFTAGESHGEALVAFLSGLPAGLKVDQSFLDRELWRRQQGYGRGGRMKIERDTAHILSGVRHGMTIGSPISVQLENRDWKNWQESLPVGEGDPARHKRVASPRPGHADLAGVLKYNFSEARYVPLRPANQRPALPSVHSPRLSCANSASKFSATSSSSATWPCSKRSLGSGFKLFATRKRSC